MVSIGAKAKTLAAIKRTNMMYLFANELTKTIVAESN
jgi:hypothetical protein